MFPLILSMIIVPAIALMLVLLMNKSRSRGIITASTLINMLITLSILVSSIISGSVSLSEQYPYIPSLGISFSFQINTISLILLIMSSAVLFASALSWNRKNSQSKLPSVLMALFQIASVGLFCSVNLFMFFIYWDIGVISLFFMINTLGSANRKSASINFLIYEIFASSLLLLGIMLIYFYTPLHSFNISYISSNASLIPARIQSIIFIILFAAFMINMPMFPMHFWLPDAYSEAPTQGSMLLSGVLTKFGAFGMLLLFAMLPIASKYAAYAAAIAGLSIFYSVFLMIRQTDIKRVISYASMVEIGIIMIGISAINTFGTYGAAYAMLSHGLTVALMFLVAGMLHEMFGERNIFALKGTVMRAASSTYAFIIGVLAMMGFPLTAGFIADILLFIGSFNSFGMIGLIPLFALVFLGAFMYLIINKSMLSSREYSSTVDYAPAGQKISCAVLVFFIFLFGMLPFMITNLVRL